MSEGMKFDSTKNMLGLVPPSLMTFVGAVLTYGRHKYDAWNWQKVDGARDRYYDAALRHMNDYREAKLRAPGGPLHRAGVVSLCSTHDLESGLAHLAHAATCIAFLLEIEHGTEYIDMDDVIARAKRARSAAEPGDKWPSDFTAACAAEPRSDATLLLPGDAVHSKSPKFGFDVYEFITSRPSRMFVRRHDHNIVVTHSLGGRVISSKEFAPLPTTLLRATIDVVDPSMREALLKRAEQNLADKLLVDFLNRR